MRKAVLISTFIAIYIMGTLLFETRALGQVYLKYGYCYGNGPFKEISQLMEVVQNKLSVDTTEIKEFKRQLCK